MKKFLTLVLALVMALAIAVPAMAFVDFEYDADSEYELDFYLVDYDENYSLFNNGGYFTTLPETDRGYATNEVVGAVVSVLVPADNEGGDASLKITSENVRLMSWDDAPVFNKDAEKLGNVYGWTLNTDRDELKLYRTNGGATARPLFQNTTDDDLEAAWLVFGKVLDDEASLTATLSHSANNSKLATPDADAVKSASYKIDGDTYLVRLAARDDGAGKVDGYIYEVTQTDGDFDDANDAFALYIFTDKNFASKTMVVTYGGQYYTVGANGKLYDALQEVTDDPGTYEAYDLASDLKDAIAPDSRSEGSVTDRDATAYLGLLEDAFGFDPALVGNKVKPAYLGQYKAGAIAEITIDIQPWTAYVSIPDVEVIDPPKTGDAATLVGFVMILAALAGVVVFKKVRA